MGKRGRFGAFFCTWKLCLFWNFLLRCPLCPGSLFRWLRSSILFQTTFFSLPAPSSQASGPVCPKQSFLSSSCLSQASVPFCPISSNSPFLSDLGALFGSRQSFPRAPTISLFLGPFLEALSLPPPTGYLRRSLASMHSVACGTFISRSLGINLPVVLQIP